MALLAAVVAPTVAAPAGSGSASSSGGSAQPSLSPQPGNHRGPHRIAYQTTDASSSFTLLIQRAITPSCSSSAGARAAQLQHGVEADLSGRHGKPSRLLDQTLQTYFAQGRANQDASNVFRARCKGISRRTTRCPWTWTSSTANFSTAATRSRSTKNQDDARTLAQKYALEMENVRSVNSAYDLATCAASPTSTQCQLLTQRQRSSSEQELAGL